MARYLVEDLVVTAITADLQMAVSLIDHTKDFSPVTSGSPGEGIFRSNCRDGLSGRLGRMGLLQV